LRSCHLMHERSREQERLPLYRPERTRGKPLADPLACDVMSNGRRAEYVIWRK
jgi:hypothetical protein